MRVTLVALTIGTLLAMACGSPSESQPVPQGLTAQSEPSQETSAEVKIGNEIGNRLPDFELTLTSNGERLTSTSLVESGRPAFLFFFATT
ncbi:MAG: hypothetical protein F4Y49_13850 [Dehalococcoidia bacterium]|nr:hypothetical protein [Dehalococcoidia bacterium]